MPRNFTIVFFLAASLFGLSIIMASTLYPPSVPENFIWRKPLVGSIFGLICILGILAVLFPQACSKTIGLKGGGERAPHVLNRPINSGEKKLTLRGHHPECGHFSAHVFQMGDKSLCAGCTGFLLGGLTAFVGTVLYFFGNLHVGQNGLLLSWVGSAGVVLGLLQFSLFNIPWSSVRLFVNAFFAFGTFLVLIGIDEIAQNVFMDLFLVILSVFWLFTRILLSRWDHERICRICDVKACEFRGL